MDFVCSNYLQFHYCKYCSANLLIFFLKKKLCLVPGPISDLLFKPHIDAVMQHTRDPELEKMHHLCIMSQFLSDYIKKSNTCRFSCTKSASLFANAVSRILLCSRKAALDWLRPVSFPRSCSSSRANFLLMSSKRFIFFLKPLDSWSYSQRETQIKQKNPNSLRLVSQKKMS